MGDSRSSAAAPRHQPSQPRRVAAGSPSGGVPRDVAALIAFIDSRHGVPHAWGRGSYSPGPSTPTVAGNDCVAFVLAAVEAQTGIRAAATLDWTDEESARRVISRYGSLESAFDAFFDRIPPGHAHRGDIGGVGDETFGIHPMIVEGQTLVGPGERGNRRVPRKAMVVAWDATSARSRPARHQPSQPSRAGRKKEKKEEPSPRSLRESPSPVNGRGKKGAARSRERVGVRPNESAPR